MNRPTTALSLASALASTLWTGCLAADDPVEPVEPTTAPRCASKHPAPDVDAVLADDTPALSAGHERFGELLALRFPPDLDFTPEHPARLEDSKRRFKVYLRSVAKNVAATYRAYDANNSDAGCAAAEVALDWVAHQFETAPIPELGDGEYQSDMRAAYCDAMSNQGGFFRAKRCSTLRQ